MHKNKKINKKMDDSNYHPFIILRAKFVWGGNTYS